MPSKDTHGQFSDVFEHLIAQENFKVVRSSLKFHWNKNQFVCLLMYVAFPRNRYLEISSTVLLAMENNVLKSPELLPISRNVEVLSALKAELKSCKHLRKVFLCACYVFPCGLKYCIFKCFLKLSITWNLIHFFLDRKVYFQVCNYVAIFVQ